MKKKQLFKDPYGSEIWFVWGKTHELNRFFSRVTGEEEQIGEGVRGHYVPHDVKGNFVRYIAIPTDRQINRFDMVAVIAHEVTHAAMCVLTDKGVKVDRENDEAFAYYHEWLFRQCLREIW